MLMRDDTACEYGALVGGECGSSTKYPSTEYVRIGKCNRLIERHFTDTLQASFANCGLKTEAELILTRAGKFETCFLFFFNLTLSCTLVLCKRAELRYCSHKAGKNKKVYLFSDKLIYQ